MPRKAESHAQILEHRHANLAGECTARFAVDILRAQQQFRASNRAGNCIDINKRRRHADIDIAGNRPRNRPAQLDRAGLGQVHFPVAGNEFNAHVRGQLSVVKAESVNIGAPQPVVDTTDHGRRTTDKSQ